MYSPRLSVDAPTRAICVHGTAGCIGGGAVRRPPCAPKANEDGKPRRRARRAAAAAPARRSAQQSGGPPAPRAALPRRRRVSSVQRTPLRCARFSAEAMRESQRRWRDGSLEEDLPMRCLSEMFNVNYFLVSQTNPHIVPALNLKKRVNRKLGNLLETEWKHRRAPPRLCSNRLCSNASRGSAATDCAATGHDQPFQTRCVCAQGPCVQGSCTFVSSERVATAECHHAVV